MKRWVAFGIVCLLMFGMGVACAPQPAEPQVDERNTAGFTTVKGPDGKDLHCIGNRDHNGKIIFDCDWQEWHDHEGRWP